MAVTRISAFSSLTAALVVLAQPAALAELPQSGLANPPHKTAELRAEPPEGYCSFDLKAGESSVIRTGYRQGVEGVTDLLAMFVPCAALERAQAGHTNWLPDWVAIETNPVTRPADDDRIAGTRGAVEMLCKDAQYLHRKIDAPTFEAKTEMALKGLSAAKPVIYFGVVGEDQGVCYLSSLRSEKDGSGGEHKLLTVVGFMTSGDHWVHLSAQREMPDAAQADEAFEFAKRNVEAFMRLNP